MRRLILILAVCLPSALPATTTKVQLATGFYIACLLRDSLWSEGRPLVKCWSVGGPNGEPGPVVVPPLNSPTHIAASRGTACAIDEHRLRCWDDGLSGDDVGIAAKTEAFFRDFTNVIDISGGPRDFCAADLRKGVKCFHFSGGETTPPFQVTHRLALGYSHACGATDENRVACWPIRNRICDDKLMEKIPPEITNPLSMSLSAYEYNGNCRACALQSGQVKCWGSAPDKAFGNPIGLLEPTSLMQIDPAMKEQAETLCALDKGQVKCRGQDETYSPLPAYDDLRNIAVMGGNLFLHCAANDEAVKCHFGNRLRTKTFRYPHGIWFRPFHLFELESAFNRMAGDVYQAKGEFFISAARALRDAKKEVTGVDLERLRLFVLNVTDPSVDATDSELFQKFLRPNWDELKRLHNPRYGITQWTDFKRSVAQDLVALQLIRGSLPTLRRSLTTTEQVLRLNELTGAVGKALALGASEPSILDLLFQYEFVKADVAELAKLSRDRGVVLALQRVMAYFK